MDKFDIRSAKLISIIGLILFIFVMVIANAYKYLPSNTADIPEVNSEINLPANNSDNDNEYDSNESEATEEEAVNNDESRDNRKTAEPEDINSSGNEITPLENIDSDNSISESNNSYEDIINNAKQFKEDKQLVKAISEYQKALNIAENSKQKAECYEEISTIYAISKKYGTALSYAQKAYNLYPSTSREILLARLYYKTGSTDKASDRINNVLRRDFNLDN